MSYRLAHLWPRVGVMLVMVLFAALLPYRSAAQILSCPCDDFIVRVGDVGCPVSVCIEDVNGALTCNSYIPNSVTRLKCKEIVNVGLYGFCGNIRWFNPAGKPCINSFGPVWQCCVNACLTLDPRSGCEMLDIQPSPQLTCGCEGT